MKPYHLPLTLLLTLVFMFTGCSSTTVTETPNTVMTFSSSGDRATSDFTVNTTPWIIQYSTSYTGRITIELSMSNFNLLVADNVEVEKNKIYQIEMEEYTGFLLHFHVTTHHSNPGWTISVIDSCPSAGYSYDNFIDDLLDSGASVLIGGEVNLDFFSVQGRAVWVNDELTNVFEYNNETLAEKDITNVHQDGYGMRGEKVVYYSWAGSPHFYYKGKLIVFYVDVSSDSNPPVLNILESILGKQFAGLPPPVTLGGQPKVYLKNKQEVSSEVLLRNFQTDEGVSDEQYSSPWYPSHTVNVGEPILIVSGTIQNKHNENTWIEMWAEGYDKGNQVAWTLDAAHLAGYILLNLETDETGEFTIHMNYSEDVSFVRIYANNYPVVPP
ncbi:hypothetical protein ACFLYB_01455 [Chloroflexota bacterium]